MQPHPLKITINALLGELQGSLQTTINLVAVALMARAPESMEDLRLPSEVFATNFASKVRWRPLRHRHLPLKHSLYDL
jgi:hypothetical protein